MGRTEVKQTRRKAREMRHLRFCKACELSERMKSWSPESNILEEHGGEKKTRPRV